jgi:endonuclease IV
MSNNWCHFFSWRYAIIAKANQFYTYIQEQNDLVKTQYKNTLLNSNFI